VLTVDKLQQKAEATVPINTLGNSFGIEMAQQPVTLHFAKSLDVRAWMVERLCKDA